MAALLAVKMVGQLVEWMVVKMVVMMVDFLVVQRELSWVGKTVDY